MFAASGSRVFVLNDSMKTGHLSAKPSLTIGGLAMNSSFDVVTFGETMVLCVHGR